MISGFKNAVRNNLKNAYGWKTPRRIVVFSVDDYGNVRLDGSKAREALDHAGLKILSRFDAFDTLETREDLEMLYAALSSVKDKNGRHAIFTPFAVPCNIDFEKMAVENYSAYRYEDLPVTYEKLTERDSKAYSGAWHLWKEGIANGLMHPQFHGREHINLKVFEEKLAFRDPELMACLANRSYTSISTSGYSTIDSTAAFKFWDLGENDRFINIIKTGLDAFEHVFGYRADHFRAPGGGESSAIHGYLKEGGIATIDKALIEHEHIGQGQYRNRLYYTGKKENGLRFGVRNVVFEPTDKRNFDWGRFTLKQIESAFRWKRPAIISSHRVNYCGHLSPANRLAGISQLKSLLKAIVHKWPDIEFMSSAELMTLVDSR